MVLVDLYSIGENEPAMVDFYSIGENEQFALDYSIANQMTWEKLNKNSILDHLNVCYLEVCHIVTFA